MLYVATGAAVVRRSPGWRSSSAARPRYREVPHVQERVTIWLHPWTDDKVFCPQTGELALRQDCESTSS